MRTVLAGVVLAVFISICSGICVAQADSSQPADKAPAAKRLGPGDVTGAHTLSGEPVYMVGGAVNPPRVLKSIDPKYTTAARTAQLEGTVVLWTVVNTQGLAEQIKVQRSLDPGLDKSAVESLEHWKFAPATKDGQPVAVGIHVEINFRLR